MRMYIEYGVLIIWESIGAFTVFETRSLYEVKVVNLVG